ncbi:hypothetical protein D3C74_409550 [compost metagenome]
MLHMVQIIVNQPLQGNRFASFKQEHKPKLGRGEARYHPQDGLVETDPERYDLFPGGAGILLGGHPFILVVEGKTQRLRFVLYFDKAGQIVECGVAKMAKQLLLGPFAPRTRCGCVCSIEPGKCLGNSCQKPRQF